MFQGFGSEVRDRADPGKEVLDRKVALAIGDLQHMPWAGLPQMGKASTDVFS